MAFFRLCPKDHLLDVLTDVFQANILATPRADIALLDVVVQKEGQFSHWGSLQDLLLEKLDLKEGTYIKRSALPDISGKKSQRIEPKIGLPILERFLKGFDLPLPEIKFMFSRVENMSFSFKSVEEKSIEAAGLGKLLFGIKLNREHPAGKFLFEDARTRLFIINSLIQSNNFSIVLDKSEEKKLNLDLSGVHALLNGLEASLKIEEKEELEYNFSQSSKLNFAFTCLEAEVERDGDFKILPFHDQISLKGRSDKVTQEITEEIIKVLPKVRFYQEAGQMDFDPV